MISSALVIKIIIMNFVCLSVFLSHFVESVFLLIYGFAIVWAILSPIQHHCFLHI